MCVCVQHVQQPLAAVLGQQQILIQQMQLLQIQQQTGSPATTAPFGQQDSERTDTGTRAAETAELASQAPTGSVAGN